MPIQDPITFATEDGLVTFTFTLGTDASGPKPEPRVTVEIALAWEGGSPPEPIVAELQLRQRTELSHISDNGNMLGGSLCLRPTPSGELVIFADISYGDHSDHHLDGVLGTFSPQNS